MIICSVSIAVIFLIVFIISAKNGQFDDDESPAVRILLEDKKQETENNPNAKKYDSLTLEQLSKMIDQGKFQKQGDAYAINLPNTKILSNGDFKHKG